MRWESWFVGIVVLLFIATSCVEEEDEPPTRCNGRVIEELVEGEWEEVTDCNQYLVAHSQTICPRPCCMIDGDAHCAWTCEKYDAGSE